MLRIVLFSFSPVLLITFMVSERWLSSPVLAKRVTVKPTELGVTAG